MTKAFHFIRQGREILPSRGGGTTQKSLRLLDLIAVKQIARMQNNLGF